MAQKFLFNPSDTVTTYGFASGGTGNCRITHVKVPERELTPLSSAILVWIAHRLAAS